MRRRHGIGAAGVGFPETWDVLRSNRAHHAAIEESTVAVPNHIGASAENGPGWCMPEVPRVRWCSESVLARLTCRLRPPRGQPVAYQGQHYQLDDFTSYPPPFQAPRPPLLVGGAGRRMLTLGGKYGDIVGLLPTALHAGAMVDPPEARLSSRVAQQVQIIRQAAGDRFSHIELSLIVSLVGGAERMAAARQVADERGWNVSADAVLQMPSILVGDTSAMAESLLETRETLGVSYIVVRDSQLELATPVFRRLAGR